jgi:hypothetical protein
MKTLLLTISLLLTSLLFSQEIKTENKKYYIDGVHVYRHEMKNILETNLKASNLYKKANKKETWGGLLIGSGIGLCIADAVKGAVSNEKYPSSLTYTGVAFVAISFPIMSGKNRIRAESIEVYNEGVRGTEKKLGYNFDVNLINNQNGIGFNITF